jgi:hypothetical protein
MSKKNEVVEAKSNEVAQVAQLDDWGQSAVSSKDIVIPKILCMQGLSDLVSQEKAKMGDFVDSLTQEVVGNYQSAPIEFIPFHLEKLWAVSSKKQGEANFKFIKFEEVTAKNENRAYNEVIGDEEYKYEYTLRFYVLLPTDTSLPYIISFKGTSTKAGKILATQMFIKNRTAGLVPPAYVMKLAGTKDKNDKGTFIVMNVAPSRKSTSLEINEAFNWFKTVTGGGVKVDTSEEDYSAGTQQEMF